MNAPRSDSKVIIPATRWESFTTGASARYRHIVWDEPVGAENTERASPKSFIANGTDGSDGSRTFSADLDQIIAEHGPLVDLSGRNPKLNHPAIAAAFASRAVIVFDAGIDGFRQFDTANGLWLALDKDRPPKLLSAYLKALADDLACPAILPMRTSGSLGAILNLVRGMAVMGVPDAIAPRIHAANGVVEFFDGSPTLRVRHKGDWATTCSPCDYVPEAKAPRFLDGLIRPAVPSAPDVDLLQRWFGAVLLGTNDAQRLLLLHGEGETGKSTFVTIVEHVLGLDYFADLRISHLSGRFESHSYQGKTLLAAKDVEPDTLLHRGAKNLKSLTGGDLIETEEKFGGKTRLRGCFNVVLTSNARLLIGLANDESAWIRRLLVVEFRASRRSRSMVNLEAILREKEGAGILTWGVEGAAKLLAELKDAGNYVLTPEQQDRIKNLVLESRSVEEFITHCVVARAGADIAVEELHAAYIAFCASRGWTPVSTKAFQTKSPTLMVTQHGSHRTGHVARGGKLVRGFKGVGLKSPPRGSKPSTERNRTNKK